MEEQRIIVKVPKKPTDRWLITWGKGGHTKKASASLVFNAIQKRLLRTRETKKTKIIVKYGKDSINETTPSQNAFYLLNSLGCFLEDYLSEAMFKQITKDTHKSLL